MLLFFLQMPAPPQSTNDFDPISLRSWEVVTVMPQHRTHPLTYRLTELPQVVVVVPCDQAVRLCVCLSPAVRPGGTDTLTASVDWLPALSLYKCAAQHFCPSAAELFLLGAVIPMTVHCCDFFQ
jgi:hypothetical protein